MTVIRKSALCVLLWCFVLPLSAGRSQDGAGESDSPNRPSVDKPQRRTFRIVPSVVGKRPEIARQILRMAELDSVCGVFYIAPQNWRPDIKPNVIYMQSPQAKAVLGEGKTVACWSFVRASEHQDVVEMPDLRGKTVDEAATTIVEVGLRLIANRSIRPRNTAGDADAHVMVIDQYPRPRQSVLKGTSVFLRLGEEVARSP